MRSTNRLSRRALLRGLAAGALATPFLGDVLSSGIGRAEGAKAPIRFFLMFTGNGQDPSHWLPSGSGANFTLSPVLEPLAAFKQKLLLAHGFVGQDNHAGGMAETTTGWGSPNDDGVPEAGPSIDQYFADLWREQTSLASLELGVLPANGPSDQTVYSSSSLPLPAIGSPLGSFQRIFDVTNQSPEEAERRRALQASVLDGVATEIESINAKLAPKSRVLLDEHLTLVREQEKKLQQPFTPISCALPEAPAAGGLAATWKAQHDNLVAAFKCDVTRVASLRAGGWGGIESGGYDEIGVTGGHHAIAHTGPSNDLLTINKFHAEQLAYLLAQLDAVEETNGTLLDNTVVVWVNELGLGGMNDHSRDDVHVVIAGGKNAGLKNGVFTDVGGVDYQHFLYTLAATVGQLPLDTFGHHGNQLVSQLLA